MTFDVPSRPPRAQLLGPEAAAAALRDGELGLLLVAEDAEDVAPLVAAAEAAGVPVWRGSAGDMRRMSPDSSRPERVIGMRGARPDPSLPSMLARGGALWLLAGVTYPSNIGFIVRTAEVSGASGVVIDAPLNHDGRSRVEHVAMGATRLLPVCYAPALPTIAAARAAGHRVVGIESEGDRAPWEVDLRGAVVLVVGAERDGIPSPVLQACDDVACLPMAGFVPSYSVQAAVSAIASERLRQLGSSVP